MHKISRQVLIFVFFLFPLVNQCKLNLNNPSDPTSKAFFETFLWRLYLDSFCDPNVRGNFILGSGNALILPMSIKVLRSGNTVVSLVSGEPIVWNGNSLGTNNNHTNSVLNGVVIVIDKSFSKILWLDYIGEMSYGVDDWPQPETISIAEYSNGDIGIFSLVNGSGRSNTLNNKSVTNAFFAARYKQSDGSVLWQGYLNKDNTRFRFNNYGMTINDFDQMIITYNTLTENTTPTQDAIGLSYFALPAPNITTNATFASQSEIGIAVINPDGSGSKQSFLPNPGLTTEPLFVKSAGDKILLAGNTTNNFPSFSGHPLPDESRVFYGVANSSLSFETTGYYGTNESTQETKLQNLHFAANQLFFVGRSFANQSLSSTIHPFQGTSGRRNYIFIKPDLYSANALWIQYLGSSSYNVPEILPGGLVYNSLKNQMIGNLLAVDNGNGFTGIPDGISSGSIQYPLGQTRLKFDPSSGQFLTIQYYNGTNDLSGNDGGFVASQVEACSGRMVTLRSLFATVATVSSNRRLEITTRPASEEP
ncbi:hypothetical protein P3G55_02045 [Leptospira sp. 96542]|nr:hypothetical protein [Leptospira sp. 96542]